jgi:hypothetical protein
MENEVERLDAVGERNFRLVTCGTAFLDALMSAGALESAIRSGKVRTRAKIAAAKDKLNQLADGGGDDPLFRRSG